MQILPFTSTDPNYEVTTSINNATYILGVRWNDRDGAWYLDVFQADRTPIFRGVKIVLGTYLGRGFNHPLVRDGALVAIDTSGARRDAVVDDLGTRVIVAWIPVGEIAAMMNVLQDAGNLA